MSQPEAKASYINELAKVAKFLPGRYYKEIKELLPEKSLNRIKNARAGIVQDTEVLKALKKISEKERKRRMGIAKQELKATATHA